MVVEQARQCGAGYDEGLLKALVDGEVSPAWREQLEQHVPACAACRALVSRLRRDGALVYGRLALLDGDAARLGVQVPRPPAATVLARARAAQAVPLAAPPHVAAWLQAGGRLLRTLRRPAPLAAGLAAGLVLVLGVAATQPAVQSFAQGVLQQFRVQRVQAVELDLSALREVPVDEGLQALLQDGTYSGPNGPRVRQTSVADAARATGFALRAPATLPAELRGAPQVWVSEPMNPSFRFNGQKLVQTAQRFGISDPSTLQQLAALDGRTISATIPAAAAFVYGDVSVPTGNAGQAAQAAQPGKGVLPVKTALANPSAAAKGTAGPSLVVVELKSPTIELPKDIDIDRLREALLRSGILPKSIANELSAIPEWKSTLVVPVPRGEGQQVAIDGTTGTLLTAGPHPGLIWERNGILYLMTGQLSEQQLLDAARSLAPAK